MSATIEATTPAISYSVGLTPQSLFTVPFPFDDEPDLVVLVNGLPVGWSLASSEVRNGIIVSATLALDAAVTSCTVRLLRRAVLAQEAVFPTAGSFSTATLNREVARIWMGLQDTSADASRALRLPDTEDPILAIPLRAIRANKALIFDGNGNPTVGDPGTGGTEIVPTAFGGELILSNNATEANTLLGQSSLSARGYGAKGDGTTDDTAALQAAMNDAVSQRRRLLIEGGAYRLTAQLSFTGSLALIGEGMAQTRLIWDAGVVSEGISGTLSGADGFASYFRAADLALLTKTPIGPTAILLVESNTAADRISPRVHLDRVLIRGFANPNTDGWLRCVELRSVNRASFNGCFMIGRVAATGEPNYLTEHCIYYNNLNGASPHQTELLVSDCFLGQSQHAVYADDTEGVFVHLCNIVGVNYGVYATGAAGYPHVSVSDCHINASVRAIRVNKMYEAVIANSLLYQQLAASAGAMVEFMGGAGFGKVSGCILENYADAVGANCIIVDGSSEILIDGNIFRRANSTNGAAAGTGVWLTATATKCKVTDTNSFGPETTTQVLNQGSENVVAQALGLNPGRSVTNIGLETQFGSTVVTLSASGGASVSFSPAFKSNLLAVVVCNGDHTIAADASFAVISASSNAAGFSFAVTPNPGAISVRVNWVAYGV